jgi:membrane protein YqaA with SNARE-associated domain
VTKTDAGQLALLYGLPTKWRRWLVKLTSERGLMGWAALEAGFPMLPVEFILVPLTRLRPSSAMHLVMLATVFSGVGAIYSYALGSMAVGLLPWDGMHTTEPWLDYLVNGLDRWGEGLVLFAAFVPAPLSIVSLGAGFLHIGLLPFLLTVVIARALRFYLVTSLTVHFNIGKQNVNTES